MDALEVVNTFIGEFDWQICKINKVFQAIRDSYQHQQIGHKEATTHFKMAK